MENRLFFFGEYPYVSLEQARRQRDEVKTLIAQGIDPREARKAQQGADKAAEEARVIQDNRTEKLARRLYASKAGRTTDDYRNTMLRQFELHLFPSIGQKHMADIEGKELFDLFKSVADKRNSRGKPMPIWQRNSASGRLRFTIWRISAVGYGGIKVKTILPYDREPPETCRKCDFFTGECQTGYEAILGTILFKASCNCCRQAFRS